MSVVRSKLSKHYEKCFGKSAGEETERSEERLWRCIWYQLRRGHGVEALMAWCVCMQSSECLMHYWLSLLREGDWKWQVQFWQRKKTRTQLPQYENPQLLISEYVFIYESFCVNVCETLVVIMGSTCTAAWTVTIILSEHVLADPCT